MTLDPLEIIFISDLEPCVLESRCHLRPENRVRLGGVFMVNTIIPRQGSNNGSLIYYVPHHVGSTNNVMRENSHQICSTNAPQIRKYSTTTHRALPFARTHEVTISHLAIMVLLFNLAQDIPTYFTGSKPKQCRDKNNSQLYWDTFLLALTLNFQSIRWVLL